MVNNMYIIMVFVRRIIKYFKYFERIYFLCVETLGICFNAVSIFEKHE